MHGQKQPWRAIAAELGFGPGYLNLVAHGKRKPSRRLLRALGLGGQKRISDMSTKELAKAIKERA